MEGDQSAVRRWEQQLTDDYRDYRFRQLLDPMCSKMQRWKAGELVHHDMMQAFEACHQQIYELGAILNQRQDRLVMLIQWLDRQWFEAWVKDYSPPQGAPLMPASV